MAHIFILYRLKAGVSREDFESWLKTRNFAALRSIKRLSKFAVFRIEKRVMTQEEASADYIDIFEIPDISGFIAEDLRGHISLKDMEEFSGFADKPEYLLSTPVTNHRLIS
jgi:hypothetical protein